MSEESGKKQLVAGRGVAEACGRRRPVVSDGSAATRGRIAGLACGWRRGVAAKAALGSFQRCFGGRDSHCSAATPEILVIQVISRLQDLTCSTSLSRPCDASAPPVQRTVSLLLCPDGPPALNPAPGAATTPCYLTLHTDGLLLSPSSSSPGSCARKTVDIRLPVHHGQGGTIRAFGAIPVLTVQH